MVKVAGGVSLGFLIPSREAGLSMSRQIYSDLRTAILEGRIVAGSRLPSTRVLAQELGVSRTTIRLAFDQLLDEGVLAARVGYGSYVPARPKAWRPNAAGLEKRERLSRRGRRTVALQSFRSDAYKAFDPGLPGGDLFPKSLWARTSTRIWKKRGADLMTISAPGGYGPLREVLADYLVRTRGLNCGPEQIIITADVLQSIDLIARLLLDEGDQVWVEEPGFCSGRSVLEAAGLKVEAVPADDAGLSVSAGEWLAPEARLVHTCPSRHYTLGMTMPLSRRLELLEWAKRTQGWIIENDYDSEFRYQGPPLPAMQGLDTGNSVIYLGSFGKTLLPSLNIGYLVAPPQMAEAFAKAHFLTRVVPVPLQAMVADMIAEGHYEVHLRRMRRAYRAREALLAECLIDEGRGIFQPEPTNSGFHFLVRLIEGLDERELERAAEIKGQIAFALSSYSHNPSSEIKGRPHTLALGFASVPDEIIPGAVRLLTETAKELLQRRLYA